MMMRKPIGMMGREAGGMEKELAMRVSMVRPCWMEKVWSWARHRVMMMVQQKIGIIPRMIFAFSTWVTLQSLQAFGEDSDDVPFSSLIAALSRNLYIYMIQVNYT